MQTLQLKDYMEGYRFLIACKVCGHSWKMMPQDFLSFDDNAADLTLPTLVGFLTCRNRDCKCGSLRITPLRNRDTHHFVGGLA